MRTRDVILTLCVCAMSTAWSGHAAADTLSRVTGSIEIADGQHAEDLSTVNGAIRVGAGAVVERAHTVNGSIELEARASASELKTVNGSIELQESARVSGSVHTVNGRLNLEKGAEVTGDLANVNGRIHVAAAHVGGGIDTTNAGIDLDDARIDGGIHMHKSEGYSVERSEPPRIVIGPGSVVKGPLEFERPVKLYVSDKASIGPVQGATAIKYSGDTPPRD